MAAKTPKLRALLKDLNLYTGEKDIPWNELVADFTPAQLKKMEWSISAYPDVYGPFGNPPEYIVPFLEDIVRDGLVYDFTDVSADGILLLQVLINQWD